MNGEHSRPGEALTGKATWGVNEWCVAADISRTAEFNLPPAEKPLSIIVGKTRRIIETPPQWARRVRNLQSTAEAA